LRSPDSLLPKDFIASPEGWLFAVVSELTEDDKVLCFLRYAPIAWVWCKLDSDSANRLLAEHSPAYLYQSRLLSAVCMRCQEAASLSITHRVASCKSC